MLWGPDAFGIRRIFALVVNLPPESALRRIVAAEQDDQPTQHTSKRQPASPAEIAAFFGSRRG